MVGLTNRLHACIELELNMLVRGILLYLHHLLEIDKAFVKFTLFSCVSAQSFMQLFQSGGDVCVL